MVNLKQKKTPQALFKDQHKELVDQGEKWMKDTATSCTVVAALITTMMFSSAFTVPDSYNGHGQLFMIFLISDAISFFTSTCLCSCSSAFSSLVTARRTSLDRFRRNRSGRTPWISAQFMVLAVVPIGMFGVLQFPVLLEIFCSTYFPREVERLVQPKHRKMVNLKQKKTPQALFKDQHKELVDQGEKWMKDTATSCTVVAALITTMIRYIFLHLYMSLLMFLGILKSRYREEDFLRSLPTKQIVGLATLFLSMTTMMVSFAVTLMTLVRGRTPWVSAQFMVLAVVPIGMFGVLQFPVLLEIFCSTYFPRVFDKPRESRRVSKLFLRK
ncbi:hypothetical protein F2Q70_00023029 [Brassica cretica]|uniref:PGG domain-containing protein n=1 Tax=Brassica cretica TaxID=69181 RepID=A0A8S9GI14_BRACR|nr:hypothetical protein F2Q70_00023029 [Brassica cretica]